MASECNSARDSLTVPFEEICSCVEFLPLLDLLCIAGGSLVSIKHCVRSVSSGIHIVAFAHFQLMSHKACEQDQTLLRGRLYCMKRVWSRETNKPVGRPH